MTGAGCRSSRQLGANCLLAKHQLPQAPGGLRRGQNILFPLLIPGLVRTQPCFVPAFAGSVPEQYPGLMQVWVR